MGTKAENFLAAALFITITGAALSNSTALTELAMSTAFGPFSSREVASATMLLAILSWATVKSADVRKSLIAIMPSIPFLLKWTLIVLVYYTVIAFLLLSLEVWHRGLIVPTSLWILTVGVVGAFKGMSGRDQPLNLKSAISLSLIAGWFVSLYTFNLLLELVYQPLVLLMVGAAIMSKKEDAVTRNVINVAYTILGLTALTPPIIGLIQEPFDRSYVETLVLPFGGLLALLPLAYALSLYSLYEGINVRLRLYAASDDVRRYALLRTLRRFHVRRAALQRFRTAAALDLFWSQSRVEVDEVFRKHA